MIPAASLFEPLSIKAVGADLRAARFAAAPDVAARGTCVLLNGQTEFIEKYFEVIDELRGRGFAVATMDWRGQGDSTRATKDSRKSFVGDFSEYDQDLLKESKTVSRHFSSSFGCSLLISFCTVESHGGVSPPL